jgi:hypothetical protein
MGLRLGGLRIEVIRNQIISPRFYWTEFCDLTLR